MAKLLIAGGADVNSKDKNGNMSLHLAAELGYKILIELFLAEGVNVNVKSEDGSTPLHLAASSGAGAAAVLQLLKAGAEADALDGKGRSPLVVAAASRPP